MIPSLRSTTTHETPRRPKSIARDNPTGPAPTIRTSVCVTAGSLEAIGPCILAMNRPRALAFIGAGLASAVSSTRASAAAAIRLTTLPVDGTALAFYANDLNYFQDAGLDVTIQTVSNGAVITAGVTSNSIDIGWSNIISLAAAHSRGLPVTIIAAGGMSVSGSLATQLMVRKDATIRTAADLNGKIIGTTGLADVGQLAPELWI